MFWINLIANIPSTNPLKNFFNFIITGELFCLIKKPKIDKKITKVDAAINIVDKEKLFSLIILKIKSYWRPKASITKQISIIKSNIRSVIIVPKDFSNGIFSYVLKVVALKISPDLGMPKFAKYAIITAKVRFINLGL